VLRRNGAYRDTCEKKWTICPGETQIGPPAVYFEDDLERVQPIDVGDTTYEQEVSRIKGGRVEHAATVAYSLKAVELIDGAIFSGAVQHRLVDRPRHMIGRDAGESIASAALACTPYGSIYFGHWMSDDLTLHLAAETLGVPVTVERKSYDHEPEYCRLMKIGQNKKSRLHFDELIIVDDHGQNAYKRQRYQALRSRLRESVPDAGNRYVYIRRGTVGARVERALVNAEEIEGFLESQGFLIVDPDHQSASQIAESIAGARLIVGVEGSHMAHALYSVRDNGAFCILQPPNRFTNVFKDYADCLDLRYGFTTGVEVAGGFVVDIEHLKRIVDRIDQVCA
jgi:capsular polysaccharide biosynthesis protein